VFTLSATQVHLTLILEAELPKMGRGSAPFRQSAGFQPVKEKKLRRNPTTK
jgi:hypothetical protein